MSEYASIDWPRRKGIPVAATDPFHYRAYGRLSVDEAWADWNDSPHNFRHWQQARSRLNRDSRKQQRKARRSDRRSIVHRAPIKIQHRMVGTFGRWNRIARLHLLGIDTWERVMPDGRVLQLSVTIDATDQRWHRLQGTIRAGRHCAKVTELYDGFVCAIAAIERLAGAKGGE